MIRWNAVAFQRLVVEYNRTYAILDLLRDIGPNVHSLCMETKAPKNDSPSQPVPSHPFMQAPPSAYSPLVHLILQFFLGKGRISVLLPTFLLRSVCRYGLFPQNRHKIGDRPQKLPVATVLCACGTRVCRSRERISLVVKNVLDCGDNQRAAPLSLAETSVARHRHQRGIRALIQCEAPPDYWNVVYTFVCGCVEKCMNVDCVWTSGENLKVEFALCEKCCDA